MTLRKDCKCACHTAPNAVIHVHPCCGPGSDGWPNVAVPDRDPYKALSLFGHYSGTKSADATPSQTKVVFNREHIQRELVPIPRRALTEEEMEWVRDSLRFRKDLADFLIPQLFAVSKCRCGTCRTVGLEPLELPNCTGRSGRIGGLGIQTKEHGPIDILLHANDGYLVEMEVIWYNFPQPFPEAWEEVSRMPDPTTD